MRLARLLHITAGLLGMRRVGLRRDQESYLWWALILDQLQPPRCGPQGLIARTEDQSVVLSHDLDALTACC